MKPRHWLITLALAAAVVGCHLCSPGDGKPTHAPAANNAAPSQPGVIPISPANTSIAFTGSTAISSQSGHFESFEGALEAPTGDPKDMRIRVVVNMDSTTTKIGLLTKHLRGDDFLDVARYPQAEFVLDGISPTGEAGIYQASGRLTLHGVQHPIAFPARIAFTDEEVAFGATITIRQTEYGMTEAAKKTKDEVPVTVSIRGRRK